MNLRPRRREAADVNLTPLIDVVFLLLIFFMVSTTFDRNAELAIELPQASSAAEASTEEVIDVSVDMQGRYYVNGQLLVNTAPETLLRALQGELGENDPLPLVVSADAGTPYQAVVVIMDVARKLGLTRLRFPTSASE